VPFIVIVPPQGPDLPELMDRPNAVRLLLEHNARQMPNDYFRSLALVVFIDVGFGVLALHNWRPRTVEGLLLITSVVG
jgi:hypothetical protein